MSNQELTHHGVKGMKWGVRHDRRKAAVSSARAELKTAKKQQKQAYKDFRKATPMSTKLLGVAPTQANKQYYKTRDKFVNSEINTLSKRVNLAKAKTSSPVKAERAERKIYKKTIKTIGMPGSAKDYLYGGAGTQLYKHIKKTKGTAYADKLERNVRNELIAGIAVSTAIYVGNQIVKAQMESK